MKRIICLILVAVTVFAVAGCGKKEKTEKRPTQKTDASAVNIDKYVKSGTMPETDYSLGDSFDVIKTAFVDSDETGVAQVIDGEEYTTVVTENINFVFNKDDKDAGVRYIVNFSKAFGFENAIDPNTVSEVMKSKNHEASLKDLDESLTKLVPGSSECECLEYSISGKKLVFVFQDNLLTATILYKKGK
ncbi:MAG: hypothetical protein MJ080_01675 [Clostridia bacterium]|nr:hypothetical protein [Clostridia bacterium]